MHIRQSAALCSLLILLILVAAPSSASAFGLKLEPGKRVLVMPFNCDIVESERNYSKTLLQNLVLTRMTYSLQKQDVIAMPVTLQRPPEHSTALSNLMQAGNQAQDLARRILGRMNEGASAEIAEPKPLSQEENTLLAPPLSQEVRRAASGSRPITSAPVDDTAAVLRAAPKDTGTRRLGLTPPAMINFRTRSPEFMLPPHLAAEPGMQQALAFDCDYVLVGNLSYTEAALGPTTLVNDVERGSIRAEVGFNYMLLARGSGRVVATGSGFGKAAGAVTVSNDLGGQQNLSTMIGKTLQQAVEEAAENAAASLMGAAKAAPDPAREEKDYYQDSPGKTLRDEPFI